jgi:hypothetical protein
MVKEAITRNLIQSVWANRNGEILLYNGRLADGVMYDEGLFRVV